MTLDPKKGATKNPEDDCEEIETKNIGLRGIVVADSNICKVDGQKGTLVYRGFDVVTLAQNSTFEEVAYLLFYDRLPSEAELESLKSRLAKYRVLPSEIITTLKSFPPEMSPMDVLQAVVPVLAIFDPDLEMEDRDANIRMALRLTALLPLVVTAWSRIRRGAEPIKADPALGHAANLLYTLNGTAPDPQTARDMDIGLILHAEHSFNASTFTARQIASTRAHMYACISGAIGSLSGALHGGANARVFKMLKEIGSVKNVRPYVSQALDSGQKIMGMGHAVYKVLDPRAGFFAPMAKRLSETTGNRHLYEISEQVRKVTLDEFKRRKGTNINANVDFYSATVYHLMGFDVDLFTPLFAIARVAGWTTHVIEEKFAEAQPKPALYRPRAEYSGRYCGPEGCDWVPREKR